LYRWHQFDVAARLIRLHFHQITLSCCDLCRRKHEHSEFLVIYFLSGSSVPESMLAWQRNGKIHSRDESIWSSKDGIRLADEGGDSSQGASEKGKKAREQYLKA
jgi:hypothetical protein